MIPAVLLTALLCAPPAIDVGPSLGQLSETGVYIALRTTEEEQLLLRVFDGTGKEVWSLHCRSFELHDFCLQWAVGGLEPATRYDYMVADPKKPEEFLAIGTFTTLAPPGSRVPASIAFASCAREDDGSAKVWRRMQLRSVDALVLLGDTPYIDTTDLAHQRKRYREFARVETFSALVRNTPLYSTWDDHDFGANDTDGRLEGKENSRRAYTNYRPGLVRGSRSPGDLHKLPSGRHRGLPA